MSLMDLGKRLLESAKLGQTEEVRLLMTNGAPFTTDWLGSSPLHMAAQYGHVKTAEVLLRAGISRDAKTKVDRTPLHVAAQEGHLEVVDLLISHGAEVDAKDMLKMTPLHWAVERGHIPVIEFLLQRGADLYSVSKFDKTAFDIAEDNCRRDILLLLQDYQTLGPRIASTRGCAKSVRVEAKLQPILPKPSVVTIPTIKTLKAIPINIKTESVSVAQIKNFINKKVSLNNPSSSVNTATATTSINSNVVKKPPTSQPVLLNTNISNPQKSACPASSNMKFSSSDSEEGETSEQTGTNVLATLAALAEATAPNATLSTSEALQWLEMHGITTLPSDNSTIVASAVEGGQTVSLTEAGKLALTWVKEHQNLNNCNSASTTSCESTEKKRIPDISASTNQKVITIVTDQSQLPSIISAQQSPIVVVSSQAIQQTDSIDSCPPFKKTKTYINKEIPKATTNGKITNSVLSAEEERIRLQHELEKIKKQAAQYKAQLLIKEHEAEQYRKQLEQMKTLASSH